MQGGSRDGAGRPPKGEKREKCRNVWVPVSLIRKIEVMKRKHKKRWIKRNKADNLQN